MKKSVESRLSALEEKLERLTATGITRVAILQDKSGSMSGRESDVIGGFDSYIKELSEDDNTDNDSIRITVAQFDTYYEVQYENAKLSEIDGIEYSVRGGTALYDSLARTIESVEKELRPQDKAIVVVVTDGHENSSVMYNQAQIKALVETKQGEGNWTFVYMGADIDAFTGGTSIGIYGGNTITFPAADHYGTYNSLATATRGMSSSSTVSTETFVADFYDKDDKGD